VIGAEGRADRKTKLVGSVDGGWPKAAHIAVTLKKAAGWLSPVQTALNGAIQNGDYAKVLNRWGKAWRASRNRKSTRPGWATNRRRDERSIPRYLTGSAGTAADYSRPVRRIPPAMATIFLAMRKWS
jgi:hypothetical protein